MAFIGGCKRKNRAGIHFRMFDIVQGLEGVHAGEISAELKEEIEKDGVMIYEKA
ncbi:MAG: hypothetical protein V8Q93_05205 [Blautia faecis]